ncbi:MAG: DUF2812 domain-containing protein [Tissierellia bacterium]|nr:DUF2812 domain-containing protein [Tissierellia bacterium]
MKKFKFFLDPFADIQIWLNTMASKGYRLKSVNNFIYEFEKSPEQYSYTTQFIGANSLRCNRDYLSMLQYGDIKTFRAPINQGNIALGKFKLRLYSKGSGKIASSFGDLNKEILIVENKGTTPEPLLTSNFDIAQQFKNIRNAYLQPIVILLVYLLYNLYQNISNPGILKNIVLGIAAIIVSVFLIAFAIANHNKYQEYITKANVME